jgi:hypothetical protein
MKIIPLCKWVLSEGMGYNGISPAINCLTLSLLLQVLGKENHVIFQAGSITNMILISSGTTSSLRSTATGRLFM